MLSHDHAQILQSQPLRAVPPAHEPRLVMQRDGCIEVAVSTTLLVFALKLKRDFCQRLRAGPMPIRKSHERFAVRED